MPDSEPALDCVLSAPRCLWALVLVAWAVVFGCSVRPADAADVVVVPASRAALSLAVHLPDDGALATAKLVRLVEVGQAGAGVLAQVVPAVAEDGTPSRKRRCLVATIAARKGAAGSRRFQVRPAAVGAAGPAGAFRFQDVTDKSLGIRDGKRTVLVYNHGPITSERVPGKDHRRTRSCYVHPVYGLGGEVLTDDFPRDHYHHHGVFWTWPHIEIDGKHYDSWQGDNIKQRFVRWLARESGPVAAVLGVENGWFYEGRKMVIERVWLRAYKPVGESRSIDVELVFIPLGQPVTLRGAGGKSYGGLTVRFRPASRKDTLITVPGGRTKGDLANTPLKWADFTSRFGHAEGPSGAAVFVSPDHPDYPPTWLTRYYGPLCVGWPGVKGRTLPPDKPIRLKYRLWIHKAAGEPAALKAAYEAYSRHLEVKWEKDAGPQPRD
jgi:hypothetical protein